MRLRGPVALLAGFGAIATAAAQMHVSTNQTYIAEVIAQIPACGVSLIPVRLARTNAHRNLQISCLSVTVPEVGCSLTDTACQCASQRLVDVTWTCMTANCSLDDALRTWAVGTQRPRPD
jgi:hypothetical protein